jgi:hypothetical protein
MNSTSRTAEPAEKAQAAGAANAPGALLALATIGLAILTLIAAGQLGRAQGFGGWCNSQSGPATNTTIHGPGAPCLQPSDCVQSNCNPPFSVCIYSLDAISYCNPNLTITGTVDYQEGECSGDPQACQYESLTPWRHADNTQYPSAASGDDPGKCGPEAWPKTPIFPPPPQHLAPAPAAAPNAVQTTPNHKS